MKLEKLVKEKKSQWGAIPHEGVTPHFVVWSKENQFLGNALPTKLDGSSSSHVHEANENQEFLMKFFFEQISSFPKDKKQHS